jgi:hypothetical protein
MTGQCSLFACLPLKTAVDCAGTLIIKQKIAVVAVSGKYNKDIVSSK